MHWGKERGSMNERAWEREREGVKTAGAVQVSKLQSFACNQGSGKGSRQECKPSAGIRLCKGHCWHHLPATWGTGHPAPTARDTHGSPHATWPSSGVSCLLGCNRTCTDPNSSQSSHGSWVDSREGGMPLCPRCGSSPGWGGPRDPHCSPSPVSPSVPAVFPNTAVSPCPPPVQLWVQGSSTCTQPPAHSPGKTKDFAPHLCHHVTDIPLELKCVLQIYPSAGVPPQPPGTGHLPPSPTAPLLQSQD